MARKEQADDAEPVNLWAADPERLDPDEFLPGSPFARLLTWAPCPGCAVAVHLPVVQFVFRGLRCPRCGAELLPPPDDPQDWLQRALRLEDTLTEQLS